MGNHHAGRSMVLTTLALVAQREKTGQTPLEILDIACEPYRGCDAEFDDDLWYSTPFGKLVQEAFDPGLIYNPDADEDGDWWYENVSRKFSDRYGLC